MTPSLASKTNRFRVLSWLVVALVSVFSPNALPHLISQKTQLALRTKRFHLLSGIPVTIVPGLFHIIHHCRFYKKITSEGEKYCGVFYPLLFSLLEFSSGGSIDTNSIQKPSVRNTNISAFHIFSRLLLFCYLM